MSLLKSDDPLAQAGCSRTLVIKWNCVDHQHDNENLLFGQNRMMGL
jgi:hypothetical protein